MSPSALQLTERLLDPAVPGPESATATTSTGRRIGVRAHRTYGTANTIRFRGRVVPEAWLKPAHGPDRWWRGVRSAFHWLEPDEVGGVNVTLQLASTGSPCSADAAPGDAGADSITQSTEVTSAPDGTLSHTFHLEPPVDASPGWRCVRARVNVGRSDRSVQATSLGECLVPDPHAAYGVISDIDNTILRCGTTEPLKLMWWIATRRASDRLLLPGVRDLYHSFHNAGTAADGSFLGGNPLFYVSSAPHGHHDLLAALLERAGMPVGPVVMRDANNGSGASAGFTHGPKESKIAQILQTYPKMRFVLLGNACQEDAAIFARIADRFPGRILVAYIRSAGAMPSRRVVQAVAHASDRRTKMMLLPDSDSIAGHAASLGLIPPIPPNTQPIGVPAVA